MLEYGNGVSQGAGRVGGGGAGGGGSTDMGYQLSQALNDTIHMVSTMPPAALLGMVVLIVVGLWVLKRAF